VPEHREPVYLPGGVVSGLGVSGKNTGRDYIYRLINASSPADSFAWIHFTKTGDDNENLRDMRGLYVLLRLAKIRSIDYNNGRHRSLRA
jgi:hypothetical protein